MKIGVPTGAKSDQVAHQRFPDAEIVQYRDLGDGFIALKTGKIDGFCFTKNIMQYVVNQNPDLMLIDEIIDKNDLALGVRLGDTALVNEINGVIRLFHQNGLRAEMEARWLSTEADPAMPDIEPAVNPSKTLIVGISNEEQPMAYVDANGNPVGFDAEYILRLAKELNIAVDLRSMEFGALIPSLQAGKIDLIISNLNVTEERKQSILFSDVYLETDIVMMARRGQTTVPTTFHAEEWAGKSIGVITGTVHDKVIAEHIPGSVPAYYNDIPSALLALKNGRVDGILTDEADYTIFGPKNPGFKILEPYFDDGDAGMLASKENPALVEKLNAFIALIRADGTHAEMFDRWIGGDESMPDIPEGTGPVLRVGTSGIVDGFSYYKDG